MKFDLQDRKSGRLDGSGEFAVTGQANIAKALERAIGKLIQNGVDMIAQGGPLTSQSMHTNFQPRINTKN